MRISDRAHLIELARALEAGTLNRSDTLSLFMLMREDAPRNSAIKDIGHTVAHDNRDRGAAYEHVNTFVDSFMTAAMEGGVFVSRVLFPIEQIVSEINRFLAQNGISLDQRRATNHSEHLVTRIADILDGTVIVTRNNDVDAELSGGPQPMFTLWPKKNMIGALRLYKGVGVSGPMLISF